MPINMGMGKLGSSTIIHKRKFRWTFEVQRRGADENGRPARGVPAKAAATFSAPTSGMRPT